MNIKNNITKIILILVGLFCQVYQLMPKGVTIIYLAFCVFLFFISFGIKKININIGFIWYFLFVLICLISLTYTINPINPDYVYIRIVTNLVLLLIVMPCLKEEENIKILFLGFLVGGLIGISIVLFKQHNLIRVTRLGGGVYGSCAEFGAICSLAMISFIWLQKYLEKKYILKLSIFLYIALALVLSGARKALLITILMPIFLQLFDNRKKLSRKFFLALLFSGLSLVIVYISLNNTYVYNAIGYRIESGITSVLGEDKEDASLYERNSFKKLAREMIALKPIKGWGMHGFAYVNYVMNGKLVYSHDGFLEILSCYGIIGFIMYYWIFTYIIINRKKILYDDIGIFLFSYIVIILLMEIYGISFYNSCFIILVGSTSNIIYIRRKQDTDERSTNKNIKNNTRRSLSKT